jgi:hypothetical protein
MWERIKIRNALSLLPLPRRSDEHQIRSTVSISRRQSPSAMEWIGTTNHGYARCDRGMDDPGADPIADHRISHGSSDHQTTARTITLARLLRTPLP